MGLARRGYEPLAIRSVLALATGKRPGACIWGAAETSHQLLAKGGAGNAEGGGVPPGVFVCPLIRGPGPSRPPLGAARRGGKARRVSGGPLAETRASVRAIPLPAVDGLWTRPAEFAGHSRISWTKPFRPPWAGPIVRLARRGPKRTALRPVATSVPLPELALVVDGAPTQRRFLRAFRCARRDPRRPRARAWQGRGGPGPPRILAANARPS